MVGRQAECAANTLAEGVFLTSDDLGVDLVQHGHRMSDPLDDSPERR